MDKQLPEQQGYGRHQSDQKANPANAAMDYPSWLPDWKWLQKEWPVVMGAKVSIAIVTIGIAGVMTLGIWRFLEKNN